MFTFPTTSLSTLFRHSYALARSRVVALIFPLALKRSIISHFYLCNVEEEAFGWNVDEIRLETTENAPVAPDDSMPHLPPPPPIAGSYERLGPSSTDSPLPPPHPLEQLQQQGLWSSTAPSHDPSRESSAFSGPDPSAGSYDSDQEVEIIMRGRLENEPGKDDPIRQPALPPPPPAAALPSPLPLAKV